LPDRIFYGQIHRTWPYRKSFGSLRFNRFDIERLMVVFTFSLAAHLVAYGGYEIGKSLHLSLPHFLTKKSRAIPLVQNQEPPLEFAMVQQPSTEAPKNAKYYGAQNSRAQTKRTGTRTKRKSTAHKPRL